MIRRIFLANGGVGVYNGSMSPRHDTSEVRRNLIGRLARSRDFSISLILHLILVVSFGSRILFEAVKEPPEFISDSDQFYVPQAQSTPRPVEEAAIPAQPDLFNPPPPSTPVREIITAIRQPLETAAPSVPDLVKNQNVRPPDLPRPIPAPNLEKLSPEAAGAMRVFREDWVINPPGGRPPEYQFTAYIGQYGKGDWNSTSLVVNNKVESGSLPNLLYFMSAFSNNRVKTDYRNVKAIRLNSDELFSVKPPFVFLTGTRDFELTQQEVENLRTYLQLGGAVWGDSSVPGKNSRFDIAFRREMKRVISDVDKDWEPLSARHPIFTKAFFPEIREVPPGLNSYREPVEVLRMHGKVAVVYTANDYGNMWQIGLDKTGQIDLRRNEKGAFVATNQKIWDNRGIYLRNLSPDSLRQSYKFGANIVIHLLDRWGNLGAGTHEL
ncbi:MAG: DUF4159 domain-containing protein [Terrimicrobiaceae bacterium]